MRNSDSIGADRVDFYNRQFRAAETGKPDEEFTRTSEVTIYFE